ncbi:40S ribosomal protein S17-2 [Morus notabilis]|uniref:40S ribosomal protein S17-2 n=1 Tax=Morus notabilis TaxID=981085 RepID=W9RPB4_9ROSA|nr:40S ribosomal protein S17-2 [Morus notabilis]
MSKNILNDPKQALNYGNFEVYYSRLTLDFYTNKKVIEDIAIIPTKRLRNKIAGFSTHLMKRIQKGLVRGISLKLQEMKRERRMDYVPDESAIKTDERSTLTRRFLTCLLLLACLIFLA